MTIGKVMGKVFQAITRQKGVARYVVENRPGRILRMQDAKQAFTLGSRNYEIVHRPLQNTSGYKLVTEDIGIGEKLAKMYPTRAQSYETMTTAEKIATLQKRADCRSAFTSGEEVYLKPAIIKIKNLDKDMKIMKINKGIKTVDVNRFNQSNEKCAKLDFYDTFSKLSKEEEQQLLEKIVKEDFPPVNFANWKPIKFI